MTIILDVDVKVLRPVKNITWYSYTFEEFYVLHHLTYVYNSWFFFKFDFL